MERKTKKQLLEELNEAKRQLGESDYKVDKLSDRNYLAAKYLQVIRALDVKMLPVDFDRVLDALEQDRYLD